MSTSQTKFTCPNCGKSDNILTLEANDSFSRLKHNFNSCGYEWTYSSYSQCQNIQSSKERNILNSFRDRNEFNEVIISEIASAVGELITNSNLAGKLTGDAFYQSMVKDEKKFLTNLSYQIWDTFPEKEFPNHHYADQYLEEANIRKEKCEEYLNTIEIQSEVWDEHTYLSKHTVSEYKRSPWRFLLWFTSRSGSGH
ncbi:MAG: hypothetical protein AAF708_20255 [Deinococcota bacterium]